MEKVAIATQLSHIADYWQPLVVGKLNGQLVKLAKLKGEFVMHHHEQEDELFFVISGRLAIAFEDRTITLDPGEFLVIPRGVPHKPIAENEVAVLLFEPATTLNTGNLVNDRTVVNPQSIL